MNLESNIEAILFFKGEPVTVDYLAKTLQVKPDAVKTALDLLETKLSGRGIVVVRNGDEVGLGTAPDTSAIIEKITKEELTRDLGKAGLETLAIVLYKGPISRKEIDYIRGVNSQFILRNLLMRGLVEKVISPNDQRVFLYTPTIQLVQFMGLQKIEDLPEYQSMRTLVDQQTEKLEEESSPSTQTPSDQSASNPQA